MFSTSQLLLPRPALAGCIFAAIVRDTRGQTLDDLQRFNHFPASPLVALTLVLEGETRIVPPGASLAGAGSWVSLAPLTVAGPQSAPLTSWNPGSVFAISIGFYPDAWARLTGDSPLEIADRTVDSVPEPLDGIAEIGNAAVDAGAIWERICDALEPHWLSTEDGLETQRRAGTQRVAAWARSLAARAAVSGPGMSVRAFERRLRRWTGQNRQSLAFYSSIEDLHQLSVRSGTEHLAAIAHDAGFSDQSHMGRALRRATGFSPARLNRLIATEEAFWCYRLLGERF